MTAARLLWVPAPYRAGFCVTDDPDTATTAQVRAVYDVLLAHGCPATKAVWPFSPTEPSGIPPLPEEVLRGATLENEDYAACCRSLRDRGVELCLHGASAGNNRRERTLDALSAMRRDFPGSRIFICHAKNAENPYWGEKVTSRAPLRALLRLYATHRSEGATEASPYFWGDACRREALFIRLYRTRRMNTLARNPCMPYADRAKPYVAGWFSATKRSFADCTLPKALERLKRQYGLTVLYQYLHRYADPVTLDIDPAFLEGVQRLGRDPDILVAPAGFMLQRLLLMQGVFLLQHRGALSVLNLNRTRVDNVQILVGNGARAERVDAGSIPADSLVPVPDPRPLTAKGRNAITLDAGGKGSCSLGMRTVHIDRERSAAKTRMVWRVTPEMPEDGHPFRTLSVKEECILFFGQLAIIAREVLLRQRGVRNMRWLQGESIPLEDHRNW